MTLGECLLGDFLYQQNAEGEYIIRNNAFVPKDRNTATDVILKIIDKIYSQSIHSDDSKYLIRSYTTLLFNQAMLRFSRDIYGESRLRARLDHLASIVHEMAIPALNEAKKYEDYGLKVNSTAPYLHRHLACIFYWFSVLKPFSLEIRKGFNRSIEKGYLIYHNEFVTYDLILVLIRFYGLTLTIHESQDLFDNYKK